LSLGRRCLIGLMIAACLAGTHSAAFHLWRSESLHHLGLILVGAAMPWLWMAAELDLLKGYWSQLIALWIGLGLNVSVSIVLLSSWRQRWVSRAA
jgi:hypothetical protein